MTLDDLVKVYNEAFWHGVKRPQDTADHAGIRAVVTAIREAIQLRPGGCEQCRHNLIVLHEILASDGVEAAGGSTREDGRVSVGVGGFSRADNLSTPAAAPDVCEWTPISEMDRVTHYASPHGVTNDLNHWRRDGVCHVCLKPISFKWRRRNE